jgi:hypothetical protein
MAQVVELLHSKCKALHSNPNIANKEKKKKLERKLFFIGQVEWQASDD